MIPVTFPMRAVAAGIGWGAAGSDLEIWPTKLLDTSKQFSQKREMPSTRSLAVLALGEPSAQHSVNVHSGIDPAPSAARGHGSWRRLLCGAPARRAEQT